MSGGPSCRATSGDDNTGSNQATKPAGMVLPQTNPNHRHRYTSLSKPKVALIRVLLCCQEERPYLTETFLEVKPKFTCYTRAPGGWVLIQFKFRVSPLFHFYLFLESSKVSNFLIVIIIASNIIFWFFFAINMYFF